MRPRRLRERAARCPRTPAPAPLGGAGRLRRRLAILAVIEADGVQVRLADGVTVDARQLDTLAGELLGGSGSQGDGIDLSPLTAELRPAGTTAGSNSSAPGCANAACTPCEHVAAHQTAEKRFERAIATIHLALGVDRLPESAMAVLTDTHLAEGNQVRGRGPLSRLPQATGGRAGVEPSRRLRDLMARLLEREI